jgi:D-alanyl-D-alanine dipeptidase
MGWSHFFRGLARGGEPIKVEHDKRAPAGVYRLGRSFGFTASRRRNHLRVTPQTVCVDDVRSPAYNTITSYERVRPGTGVERLTSKLYREGLFVDYPTDAAARAGSCIFIHVWRTPQSPTSGCVALPEARVKALQDFAALGAVIDLTAVCIKPTACVLAADVALQTVN